MVSILFIKPQEENFMFPQQQNQSEKNIALLNAAKNNNAVEVKRLIKNKANLTQIDTSWSSHGWTAIHWAAYHDNLKMVLAILERYPQAISTKTSAPWFGGLFGFQGNQTPADIAIQYDKKRVKSVLQKGDSHYFLSLFCFWKKAPPEICRLVANEYLSDSAEDKTVEMIPDRYSYPYCYKATVEQDIQPCCDRGDKAGLKSLCLDYIRQRVRLEYRVDEIQIPNYGQYLEETETECKDAEQFFDGHQNITELRDYTIGRCYALNKLQEKLEQEQERERKQEEREVRMYYGGGMGGGGRFERGSFSY